MSESETREARIDQIIEKVKSQPGVQDVIMVDEKGFTIKSTLPDEQANFTSAFLLSVFGQFDKYGKSLGVHDIKSITLNAGKRNLVVVSYGNLYMIAIRSP